MIQSFLQLRIVTAGLFLISVSLLAPAGARAQSRLNVLIVSGQSSHDWQQSTAAITATLRNTGRFNVDRSTSPPPGSPPSAWAAWQPQFANYDVVISDYQGEMWPAGVRAAFEAYIAGGGGAVIVHVSTATFFEPHLFPGEVEWDAYSLMIGLGWRLFNNGQRIIVNDATNDPVFIPPPFGGSSNHGVQHRFTVKSRRPAHPIMNGLPTEWLHGKDEFNHAMRGPAVNLEVLASAFSAPETGGTGFHEPMLWTVQYGGGRVVTTVMGHRQFGSGYGAPGTPNENGPDAVHCVGFQTLLARTAEWAAMGAVTVPVPSAFPSSAATSISDPLRGVWLKLGMKINGQHPASDVVVTPGPVQLTLDMAPGGFTSPLGFYFAVVVQGVTLWFTPTGPSLIPAPLGAVTPLVVSDASLLSLNLAPGSSLSFLMAFVEGTNVLTYDVITAIAP